MKFIVFLLLFIYNTSYIICQENNNKEIQKIEKAKKRKLEEMKSLENEKTEEAKRVQNIERKQSDNSSKKKTATLTHKEYYEHFEYEKETDYPSKNSPYYTGKTIHVHCPPVETNIGYSSLYLIKSKSFEDNIEIQTDWMIFISLSLRATILKDDDFPHFTFFTGINAQYFQIEYGFSGGEYNAIRLRRSFNFFLAQKISAEEKYHLFEDYSMFGGKSDSHYHYQNFISSIYIEPTIEVRFEDHKTEFAIGLGFGVSF